MDAVLLDTDVYSYLLKGDSRADAYRRHLRGRTPAISFVTVGELYVWAQKRGWGATRITELERRLRAVVIVPFDLEVCRAYAGLSNLKLPDGTARTIAANDRWIAACAIRHGVPLLSNNRRHFEDLPGLTLICEAPAVRVPRAAQLPLVPGDADPATGA